MKKISMKPQQSCTELSKYKFIPPAKLMKAKNHHHFQSLIQSNSMTTNQSYLEHEQSATVACKKKQPNRTNTENEKDSNKKQDKLFRSISNPRLQPSNSRNAILTQKTQPCESYKNQQIYFDKLSQFMQQFQNKEFAKNSQIASLRQENKQLSLRLDKTMSLLSQKNKQVVELTSKNQQLEGEIRQKNHQHSLIIDSLKKIIESQAQKIHEMKLKLAKLQKGKHLAEKRLPTKNDEELNESRKLDDNQSFRSEINEYATTEDKQKIQNKQRKCKRFLKFIQNTLSEENCEQEIKAEGDQINSMSLQGSREDITKRKTPTPDFGSRTPTSQDDKISLQSSLEHDQANLTLSRISQSVEEDFETSRQNIGIDNSPQMEKQNPQISTHQQLLDQIDQYLSKKTNLILKR